ncbi:MAG: transcriptional regulator, partial [Halobacteriaceae archaeon]
MAEKTTRQVITDRLREKALTPTQLSSDLGISTGSALSHLQHVASSMEQTNEQVIVRPPECEECGFSNFDDLLNVPSRCPECNSERVKEPAFRITER